MLLPVPRAKIEIATWEVALQHVRARSTDLRVAAYTVERAEAQQIRLAGRSRGSNCLALFRCSGICDWAFDDCGWRAYGTFSLRLLSPGQPSLRPGYAVGPLISQDQRAGANPARYERSRLVS